MFPPTQTEILGLHMLPTFLAALLMCLIIRPTRSLVLNGLLALLVSAGVYVILEYTGIDQDLIKSSYGNSLSRFIVFFVAGSAGSFPVVLVIRILRGIFFSGDRTEQSGSYVMGSTAEEVVGCAVTYNRSNRMVGIGNLPVDWNRAGGIVQIGDMVIAYGTFGRAVQIGVLPVAYSPLGQVTAVGEIPVMHGPMGRIIQVDDQPIEYTMTGQLKTVGSLNMQYTRFGRLIALVPNSGAHECMLTRKQIVALVLLFQQIALQEEQQRHANQQFQDQQRRQRQRNNSGW